jgi:protein O-mannosyl-transferase
MAEKTSSLRFNLLVCLTLTVLASIVYWQVAGFDLVGLDDDSYISQNPYVLLGFRNDTVRWAFSAVYQGIWHPMIWLSYMADTEIARSLAMRHIQVGPGNSGVYHLTNAVQHLLSAILLFFIFLRMTGSRWRSAFVAAIFAVHPLNVESVAWVAERKNTLSTLLCMLTMLAYLNYVRRPGWGRYALMIALFVLGLMAKAVLVTLPVMLLFIDYWPLRRFEKSSAWLLLREKLPMFGLAAASGVMAFIAQRMGGLVAPDDAFPFGVRIANAFVSFVKYIWLMIVPRNLSVCYVHPGRTIPAWLVLLCAAMVVGITVFAIQRRSRTPYLFVGWMWYLATILPVIGIVQVADQGLADRYIYIPMIGLLIIAAWGLPDLLSRFAPLRLAPPLTAAACVVLLLLTMTAHKQVSYWRDGETMYRQVIKVNPTSRTGYSGLGSALAAKGQHEEAQACLHKAIEIDPRDVPSRINMGIDLAVQGRLDEASYYLRQAMEMWPGDPRANYNLARILVMRGKLKEAEAYYSQAVESQPSFVEAQIDLANTLLLLGKPVEAVAHYSEAIRLRPNRASTHILLAGALEELGQLKDAIGHYREAIRLDPRRWDAANNLAWILATQSDPRYSDPREAIRLAETTCRQVKNRNPQLLDTLAVAYAADGRYEDAAATARRALGLAESAKQARMVREIRAKLQRYETRLSERT